MPHLVLAVIMLWHSVLACIECFILGFDPWIKLVIPLHVVLGEKLILQSYMSFGSTMYGRVGELFAQCTPPLRSGVIDASQLEPIMFRKSARCHVHSLL
jgi:hypothetical protein